MSFKSRITAGLLIAIVWLAPLDARGETATEEAIKAAVAHKITKFVQWPADADTSGPIRFCVAGSTQMLDALERLQSHAIKGRAVMVSEVMTPTESSLRCDALYISTRGLDNPSSWLEQVAHLPILTFAEFDSEDVATGIVILKVRNNKVSFDIDANAGSRAGITIGAQLLQLAAMSNGRSR